MQLPQVSSFPGDPTRSEPQAESALVSLIVPAHNSAPYLDECLSALRRSAHPRIEIIVVDDASTDETASVAARSGARVLRLPQNSGPAAARNHGARAAGGEILFFVDADIVVALGTIDHVVNLFADNPTVAAAFGSYDAHPRAEGLVSRYRNLLHHFVHQHGNPEASTFWAGCGAIRRSVFEALGGFDASRFPHPSIEDIELGYRLRQAGHRILLDKALQGTHLKKWTLRSLVHTDVWRRAVPWSRLILETTNAPNDLNLRWSQRLSVSLVALASVSLPLSLAEPRLLGVVAAAILGVIIINRELYAFFFRERGLAFAAGCVPLHLSYYLYSGASYLAVWVGLRVGAGWTLLRGTRSS